MPGRQYHKRIAKKLLAKYDERVDELIDLYRGRNHRKKWGHNVEDLMLIAFLLSEGNDEKFREVMIQGFLHIMVDKLHSRLRDLLKNKGFESELADLVAVKLIEKGIQRGRKISPFRAE
ncbi:hypothetical protein [Sulfurisphaera ohwakuensis]|uniref:Uncharacterized protein n=1 Tax=Sulfurisphaera ohwakuensis TaxID=69656 RepID=A0A650CDK9_SULOH|nr:hypothetical protein [Sulfurisphaera ohwakuensis]MBB5253143.1 hypothetical protein [Sulfurisphaera ohwakuensis]QGR15943.1 hypothetical protein D1869_01135 [Sulfurisphaera ohwakuensis]